MTITLRTLIENGIIDENQKVWIYEYDEDLKKNVSVWRGHIYSLVSENVQLLDETGFTIQEIQKRDLRWLNECNFKPDYIGIYFNN